jgi:O-antigen chain-terminating methyltransferase
VDKIPSLELQLLAVRRVIDRIEAVLSWIPDPALLQEAEGTQLHLSSHLFDPADGRMLVFDGPRAVPGLGPDQKLSVLPLPMPPEPGCYRLQIEPVVELRFWASDRGYTPLFLDIERMLDDSVVISCAASKRQFIVTRIETSTFRIDTPLYGLGDSERCVEIPWVLSRFRGESHVLDVGYANAEPRYLQALDALGISFLVGLDISQLSQPGISGVAADVLRPPFRDGAFDVINAISVIEHIGRDNSVYHHRDQVIQEFGDLEAAARLTPLLQSGGRLLVTLPFGRLEDHGWFIQYDRNRISALVEATGLELTTAEYYAYSINGWSGPLDPLTLGEISYRIGFGAGAVACLELTRQPGNESKRPGSS